MSTVTYSDPDVGQFVDTKLMPVRIDVTDEGPGTQRWIHDYNEIWTPTLIVCTPSGAEARRLIGFFPPAEFVPEISLGIGMVQMHLGKYSDAERTFLEIVERHEASHACPEALYWRGVAAYKDSHDGNTLVRHWKELKERYPRSEWWSRCSFIEST